MYYFCNACEEEFDKPDHFVEKSYEVGEGIQHEVMYTCPYCGSFDFEETDEDDE